MEIDVGCPESIDDPASYFGAFAATGDAHRSTRPRGWALIGHEVVAEAFREETTLSADRITVLERVADRQPEEFRRVIDLLSGWMIFRDPPVHTDLRHPVRAAFTHRSIGALDAEVARVVEHAFDRWLSQNPGASSLPITEVVCRPVPALVIGAMLGVAPDDRTELQHWSDQLAPVVFSLQPGQVPAASVVAAADHFHRFFGDLLDRVGADDPGLIAHLVTADTGLDRMQLIGLATMLLFAGHETTTGLMQQMTAVLCERPELAERLRSGDVDLGTAVDEFLRCYGSARTMFRKVVHRHERAGVTLEPGDTVLLSIAGANHDRRVFDDPGRFDPTRDPNPHLSFGWGLHHCLGAQLARTESVAFLRALLDRFADIRSVGPTPPLVGSTMGFGREALHLAV